MNNYRWIITHDHLDGMDTGVEGPHNASDVDTPAVTFRMYDDDNELYYTGKLFGDASGFEPLDDYGTPNAGCTRIDILEGSTWKTL